MAGKTARGRTARTRRPGETVEDRRETAREERGGEEANGRGEVKPLDGRWEEHVRRAATFLLDDLRAQGHRLRTVEDVWDRALDDPIRTAWCRLWETDPRLYVTVHRDQAGVRKAIADLVTRGRSKPRKR